MKIIIHSLDELLQLARLLDPRATMREVRIDNKVEFKDSEFLRKYVTADVLHPLCAAATTGEPEGLPTDIAQPHSVGYTVSDRTYDEVQKDAEAVHVTLVDVAFDADGAPYSTDWHSDPAKLTAKGLWRARRGRDEDAYKAWLLDQAVEAAEAAIARDEAETVATETHALPQDEGVAPVVTQQEVPDAQDALQAPASSVDLEALIAASQEAALDASDSHVDLLNACRDFTRKHGPPAFTALKAAVAPDGDSGQGKTVQHLTPGERRLMQACIANYPSKEA